jgi:hypothetical protein
MQQKLKELRVSIDGLAQLAKELKPMKVTNIDAATISYDKSGEKTITHLYLNSKQVEKAVDSLYLAKAWVGKILAELGETTPYANDGTRKTVEDIEPVADSVRILEIEKDYIADKKWSEMNHIEKVDWLRQEIEKVITHIKYTNWNVSNGEMNELHFDLVYKYLCEAKFWLGFELQRLKESK